MEHRDTTSPVKCKKLCIWQPKISDVSLLFVWEWDSERPHTLQSVTHVFFAFHIQTYKEEFSPFDWRKCTWTNSGMQYIYSQHNTDYWLKLCWQIHIHNCEIGNSQYNTILITGFYPWKQDEWRTNNVKKKTLPTVISKCRIYCEKKAQ